MSPNDSLDKNLPNKDQSDLSRFTIPETNISAPLAIDEITNNKEVPTVNKNDSLNYESQSSKTDDNISDKVTYVMGFIMLIVILLAGTGMVYLFNKHLSNRSEPIAIKTVDSSDVSADENKVSDYSPNDVTVEVLNGSTKKGIAKVASDKLEAKGFQVTKLGNADSSSYKENEIYIDSSLINSKDKLIADLSSYLGQDLVYKEGTQDTESLVVIILSE